MAFDLKKKKKKKKKKRYKNSHNYILTENMYSVKQRYEHS